MRIGIITHNYPASKNDRQNAGIFVYDMAHALQKLGHQVFVLCPKAGQKEEKDIVKVIRFNWMGKGTKLGSFNPWNPKDILLFFNVFFSGFGAAENFVEKNNIDFVISMWAIPAGIFALWANLRKKVPYTIWALGSDIYIFARYPLIGSIVKLALRTASFLIADGIDLAKQTSKIAGKKCDFLPSASNLSHAFGKSASKKGPIRFIFLGRMEPVKGPDILIESICKLKDLDFQLHCLGDGSLLSILKKQVEEKGLNKKVIFYGNVSDPKIISGKLSSSDWVVIPSRSDSIPLVFSESMKAGTPLIVAEVGDMVSLVEKYKVGLSFPKENKQKLANILRKVITEGRGYVKIYQKNTKKAAEIFDVNFSAKELILMIEKNLPA